MKAFPRQDAALSWVSVRRGDEVFKLRSLDGRNWRVEAFDLGPDPTEGTDLFDPQEADHLAMKAELERYKSRLVESAAAQATAGRGRYLPESGEEAALEALGYILPRDREPNAPRQPTSKHR